MRTTSFVFCAASLLAVFSLVSIYFQYRLLHLHSSVLASKGIVPSHDIHEMNQQDYHQYQRHPKINSPKPKPPQRFFASTTAEVSVSECSPYQITALRNQLQPNNSFCFNYPWTNQCPITVQTKCPDNVWLQSFYHRRKSDTKTFLAINVGCNKGTDAVKMLHLVDPFVDLSNWRQSFAEAAAPQTVTPEVCADTSSFTQTSTTGSIHSSFTLSSPEMMQVHCIEPLPVTHEVLERANSLSNYAAKGLNIHSVAISSESGTVFFPKPRQDGELYKRVNVGTENKGIGSCTRMDEADRVKHCIPVHVMTLDSFVAKYLPLEGTIQYILTDVEGYDFDVLLGANNTLHRTEYLEFEFNRKDRWGLKDRSIAKAVNDLDNHGFTCYWAGVNKLWRITNCLLQEYETAKFWSNVACVNRKLAVDLASEMELLFMKTVTT